MRKHFARGERPYRLSPYRPSVETIDYLSPLLAYISNVLLVFLPPPRLCSRLTRNPFLLLTTTRIFVNSRSAPIPSRRTKKPPSIENRSHAVVRSDRDREHSFRTHRRRRRRGRYNFTLYKVLPHNPFLPSSLVPVPQAT